MQRDAMGLDLTRLRGALGERTREVVALQTRNDALRSSLACRRQDIEVSICRTSIHYVQQTANAA